MTIFNKLSQGQTRSMSRGDSNVQTFAETDPSRYPFHQRLIKAGYEYEGVVRTARGSELGYRHPKYGIHSMSPHSNSEADYPRHLQQRPAYHAASVVAGASTDPAVGRRKELEGVFSAGTTPNGVSPRHHAVLTRHGFKYSGRGGEAGHHYYVHPSGHTAIHHQNMKGGTTVLAHGKDDYDTHHDLAESLDRHLSRNVKK